MEVPLEQPAEEIRRLQRCINHLASILALPAIWSGNEPSQIVHTLLDALLSMLDLDLVYMQLKDPAGKAPIETIRVAPTRGLIPASQEISELLSDWVGDDPQKRPPVMRKTIGDGVLSIVPSALARFAPPVPV